LIALYFRITCQIWADIRLAIHAIKAWIIISIGKRFLSKPLTVGKRILSPEIPKLAPITTKAAAVFFWFAAIENQLKTIEQMRKFQKRLMLHQMIQVKPSA